MSSFHFNNGSIRNTVVRVGPGNYLETRRNDFTWSAAFRATHPDVKQRSWPSLADWHKCLPLSDPNVEDWKRVRGWVAPASATADGACKGPLIHLSQHMAYVMGASQATEEEVFDAIMELSAHNPDAPVLRFLLGNAFEAISSGDILGALEENGHILEKETRAVASSPPLLKPSDLLPTVATKKARSDSDMETDEAEATPVLEVREVVGEPKKNPFALVESVLEFNRRWNATHQKKPTEVMTPKKNPFALVDSILEFNRKWNATQKEEDAPKKPEPIRFVGSQFTEEKEPSDVTVSQPAVADPFAEINAVYTRVAGELLAEDNTDGYKQLLVQQFVTFCLRPVFAALWRSNAFERIQMRATLLSWLELTPAGENEQTRAVINRFLTAYPV